MHGVTDVKGYEEDNPIGSFRLTSVTLEIKVEHMNTNFTTWLDTFLAEKGTDLEHRFEVDGPSGLNSIPVGCVVEALRSAPRHEQDAVRDMLVRIDFANGDHLHFLGHLAGALAR